MRYTAVVVTVSQRYLAPGQLQFITSSVYCRMKLFESPRAPGEFAEDGKRGGSLSASWRSVESHLTLIIPAKAGMHCRGEAAPRPYDCRSRASGNLPGADPRPSASSGRAFRGDDDNFRCFGWNQRSMSTRLKARANRAKSGSCLTALVIVIICDRRNGGALALPLEAVR
jgi:hypothetical protein